MKILLLSPSNQWPMRSEAPQVLRDRTRMPPLGLLRLHAALSAGGHQVKLLDAGALNMDTAAILPVLRDFAPALVGLGTTTAQLVDAWRLCRRIKGLFPNVTTVLGGPHLSFFPSETAQLPGVDLVLRGEADETMPRLAQVLEEGGDPVQVPGVHLVRDGQARAAPEAPLVKDLDALPPIDRRASLPASYRDPAMPGRLASVEMVRGCPYACSFCSTPRGAIRHRAREPMADEMMRIQKDGLADSLYFVDDTWNVVPKKALGLCEELTRRGFRLPWVARLRINTVKQELLDEMRTAACVRVQFGVEAGSEEGLQGLNKQLGLDRIRGAFRMARKARLDTVGYFMLGLPTDRSALDLRRTVAFAEELKPDYALFNVFTPYPGTALFRLGVKKGIVDEKAWSRFAAGPDPDFAPQPWTEHLPPEEIYGEMRRAYRKFYFRPRRIASQLLRPATWGRAVSAAVGLLRG